ncbi:MAG: V-type ATP synthase subunit I [Promethearchaeota archaeon]
MKDSNLMCLFKVIILNDEKDNFLNYLAGLNLVHIKENKKTTVKEKITDKNTLEQKVRKLSDNLNSFFDKIGISENTFENYKIKTESRSKFNVKDLGELIYHISDELNFFINRYNELERYIAIAKIELENLTLIKKSYIFLEKFNLKRSSLSVFNHLDFKVYSTFKKNIEILNHLLNITEFPNVYQISSISDESIVFYVIYPKDHEEELKNRINIIHAEEIPILKKYLTTEGINFTRIVNELEIVENTLAKDEKEIRKIRDDNLHKFAAFNEIINNIEQYLWAEKQFEEYSSQYSAIEFYAPLRVKDKLIYGLNSKYKEKIQIESSILAKHPVKLKKTKNKEIKIDKINKVKSAETYSNLDDIEEIDSSQEKSTPTLIKRHSFFIRPFESLTKMYGVPSYAEVDPTPFLAITFPVLFGLMFGDIGHGMVLIIAGLLGALIFKRKKGKTFYNFCWIIFYCGWGAILGGLLYGEFFGGEYIFNLKLIGIWENPLGENLTYTLWFVILVGVFHINLGWTIQAFNYWRQHRKYMAFSDSIVKILLLSGGTYLLFFYGFDINSWTSFPYPILLPLIPGLLLIVLKPLGKVLGVSYLKTESFGSLMGEGSLEAFETLLSVLSNAASYIRLLALALAHLALLITIEALVNLISGGGIAEIFRIIVLILGNFLVILIEGLLAFINNLRLHFYEFFFKFFKGSGIEFTPFFLNNQYSEIVFKVEEDIVSEEIEKEIVSKIDESYVMDAKKYLNDKFS